jgi:hypothetical protein
VSSGPQKVMQTGRELQSCSSNDDIGCGWGMAVRVVAAVADVHLQRAGAAAQANLQY